MRFAAALALCTALVSQATCADDRRAVATRISTIDQVIGGPKALAEVGDYLLENDKIRVIIHGPGPNRANTVFAGSLIDADLQRPEGTQGRGRDQVQEILPAFVFEVMDPSSFTVTRDGSDGGPAVVTLEGVGGEALQLVALLNTGLLFPQSLRFRVEYILEPGKSYVQIDTTVVNDSDSLHPLPYLDPPDLRDLGLDIPNLDQLQLSVPFGHLVILGGEQEPFMPGRLGFNVKFGITDLLEEAPGLPAFPGAVGDFIATRGDGVSYGLTVPGGPDNYVNAFRDAYSASQPVKDYSLVAPFFFAGTVGVYHTNPPRELQPAEEFTFTTYFVVGRGDVASVADSIYDIHGVRTGTFAGRVYDAQTQAPIERASLVVQDENGNYVNQLETDIDGRFRGQLPVGSYRYKLVKRNRDTSRSFTVEIREDETSSELIAMAPTSRLSVQVTDTEGRRIPCKLTLVGTYDPAETGRDPRDFLYDLAIGEELLPTAFEDGRNEYIEHTWYAADGLFEATVRPGDYQLVVSRGLEYDTHRENITLREGGFVAKQVSIEHSVDTNGYVAIDTHLHAVNSPDSGMDLKARVISIAGEGVEYAVATDHNAVTDYQPAIGATGLTNWLVSSVGIEVTTFEMGHFNGFPLVHDSSSVRGGDILWAGFDPGEIFQQIRERGKYDRDDTLVQVNHPRWESLGYFSAYNFDQDSGEVVGLSGLRAVFAPFSDEFSLERYSWEFDALEIINGKRQDLVRNYRVPETLPPPPIPPAEEIPPAGEVLRDANNEIAFPGALDDWFVLLNQGRRLIGVGSSDSHKRSSEAGYARSLVYIGRDKDIPGGFSELDVVRGMRSGRVIITTGPMIELFVNDRPMGSDVTDTDGSVELSIRAQVPDWIEMDKAVVYANGEVILDIDIPAGERNFTTNRSVDVAADSWFVLEVTGPTNLFPVIGPKEFRSPTILEIVDALGSSLDLSALDPFGNLKPSEAQKPFPQAITNPIWVDTDGNGQFDPPGVANANSRKVRPGPLREDVRRTFENIPRYSR
ncbi:MAG: CehA/McbA family metallohydrolase [Deltaproteobacteria bacterium]|nr:CehA/McbA family metallohydrolase [Deltaproteobacteria bacterium]